MPSWFLSACSIAVFGPSTVMVPSPAHAQPAVSTAAPIAIVIRVMPRPPALADDLPLAVGLTAGGSVRRLLLAADVDGLRVLAAVLAARRLVRAFRRHRAGVSVVRVLPCGRGARRRRF